MIISIVKDNIGYLIKYLLLANIIKVLIKKK